MSIPATVTLVDQLSKQNLTTNEAYGLIDTIGISADSAALCYSQKYFSPIFDAIHFDNAANSRAYYWMAIRVSNKSSNSDWYLELHDPHLGEVSVFELENGKAKAVGNSGFHLPFGERAVPHKNHFFVFSVVPGSEKILLVRLHSSSFAKFYVSVVKSSQMVEYSLREYWFLGVYYGGLFILLIYNFVLFLSTRQKPFFWYSIFVAICILNAFREDGLGFQFVWPSYPAFNYYHFDISTILLVVSFTGFACSFLDIRKKAPALFTLLVLLVVLYVVSHLTESFLYHTWLFNSYVYPIPFVVVFCIAFQFALKQDQPALLFLIGFAFFLGGVICFFLRVNGFIPSTIYFIYAPNFSVLSEVAIMSYALAGKYRKQQELLHFTQQQEVRLLKEKAESDQRYILQLAEQDRLKESLNQALEKKVAERTTELHAKNEELHTAYQQLSFYKERLESDWVKLDKEKWELSQQVNERILDNIKGMAVSFEAFSKIFPSNEVCMLYLSELKWSKGFVCRQCGNTRFSKGDVLYSRKCTRCTHRETVTAGTLFHGVKIDLTKAFYLTHVTLFGNGKTGLKELAEQLQLRTATCWNFKRKAEKAKELLKTTHPWEEILLQE